MEPMERTSGSFRSLIKDSGLVKCPQSGVRERRADDGGFLGAGGRKFPRQVLAAYELAHVVKSQREE